MSEEKTLGERVDALRAEYAQMIVEAAALSQKIAEVRVTLDEVIGQSLELRRELEDREQAIAEHEMAVHVERTLALLRNGATDE